MADFSDIKTEFSTIATAQSGITTFKYGRRQELNKYITSAKPLLLLFKQQDGSFTEINKRKVYNVQFGIYDTYGQTEQGTTAYDVKQKALENLGEQFLREFIKRSLGKTTEVTEVQDWVVDQEDISFSFAESLGIDGLVGIEYEITLDIFSDCDEGTFSY